MTKLELVFEELVKLGFKAKKKEGVVSIRGYRFSQKGETIFVYNHRGQMVGYGYHIFNAICSIGL